MNMNLSALGMHNQQNNPLTNLQKQAQKNANKIDVTNNITDLASKNRSNQNHSQNNSHTSDKYFIHNTSDPHITQQMLQSLSEKDINASKVIDLKAPLLNSSHQPDPVNSQSFWEKVKPYLCCSSCGKQPPHEISFYQDESEPKIKTKQSKPTENTLKLKLIENLKINPGFFEHDQNQTIQSGELTNINANSPPGKSPTNQRQRGGFTGFVEGEHLIHNQNILEESQSQSNSNNQSINTSANKKINESIVFEEQNKNLSTKSVIQSNEENINDPSNQKTNNNSNSDSLM